LVHADYSDRASVRVIKRPLGFEFRNPGALRVPVAQALKGGESDCRNRTVQQMFLMINLGERAGSGLPRILASWQGGGHMLELMESFEPYDQSVLTMGWAPEKTSEKTPEGISRLLQMDPNMTIAGLASALGKTTRTIERTLAAMQEQGKIQRIGGDKGGSWKVLK
jgi:predicted HTH transcriptional regulator